MGPDPGVRDGRGGHRLRHRGPDAPVFALPTRRDIDPPLVLGAAIFGVGWGIAGLCPGPGVTALASGRPSAILFVAAMLVGMAAGGALERRPAPLSGLRAEA
jgi:uncharacterized membrane protein YedE/YeeE